MSIVYMRIGIAIHGLNIKDQALAEDFLTGWLRESTRAALKGDNADLFGFRDEFDTDIEVEVEEHAGEGEK